MSLGLSKLVIARWVGRLEKLESPSYLGSLLYVKLHHLEGLGFHRPARGFMPHTLEGQLGCTHSERLEGCSPLSELGREEIPNQSKGF